MGALALGSSWKACPVHHSRGCGSAGNLTLSIALAQVCQSLGSRKGRMEPEASAAQVASDAQSGLSAAKRARQDSHSDSGVPAPRDQLVELRALCAEQQQQIDYLRWREELWGAVAQRAQPPRELAYWTRAFPLGEKLEITCAAVASDGTQYICTESALYRKTLSGDVQLLGGHRTETGLVDGVGASARLNDPNGIALDERGSRLRIFLADTRNHAIRVVDVHTLEFTTLAGAGYAGFSDGLGRGALFHEPWGIVLDEQDRLFVADSENHCLRWINLATRAVSTFSGAPQQEGCVDGSGSSARFLAPSGMAQYGTGCLCVSDTGNDAIRVVILDDVGVGCLVVTISPWPLDVDGVAGRMRWDSPQGIVVDGQKNILVANSCQIRLIRAAKEPQPSRTEPSAFLNMSVTTLVGRLPKAACGLALDLRGRLIICASANSGEVQVLDTGLHWRYARILYIGALKGNGYSSSERTACGGVGEAGRLKIRCLFALLPRSGKDGWGCPLLAYIIRMVIFCSFSHDKCGHARASLGSSSSGRPMTIRVE